MKGTKTKILDTRKTTPGIRALEKWAVTIGGCKSSFCTLRRYYAQRQPY